LHFAHGYLISTFLSPVTNKRSDEYGGSLENRMRFGLEITESVRKALPEDIVLGVKVSVSDYADNGWDVKQSVEFAKRLKALGVDYITSSSGGVVSGVDYKISPEIQLNGSEQFVKEVGITAGAVGNITNPQMAENILQQNKASLIFIARAFLNEPHWPYRAADALADGQAFQYPKQYNWCIGGEKWRKDVFAKQNP